MNMYSPTGPEPQIISCPNCHANVLTRVKRKNGFFAWFSCVACCVVGLSLGCCLLPFCVNAFKDVEHYCPSCNIFLGRCTVID